ncbi:MAG: efflux RND transporter periplasmic adaptor subunit [bacterium]|nr:efflux RND transporter periplasmic adaptor subunit [bacterium]
MRKVLGKLFTLVKKVGKAKKRSVAVAVVILLILFWRVWAANQSKFTLTLSEAQYGTIVESVSASGEVKAGEVANLTFPSAGKVAWVGVKEGDFVNKYQGIAKLDTLALSAAYQEALNNYRDKEALAAKAEDDVKDHAGDETFAQKATRTTAQVARDNAYDAVRSAEQTLKFATLVTPISGLVVEANPEVPGINVSPGTAIYTIVNPDSVYFSADVNEVDVSQVYVGQKAFVRLDAYPVERFEGKIRKIGFQSVTTTTGATAYPVVVELAQSQDLKFRVGMNGDVEFLLEKKEDILLAPATSIVEEKDKTFAWIVNGEGKAEKIEVKTGASSIDSIEVISGLSTGNKVINRPPSEIKAGDKIKASN